MKNQVLDNPITIVGKFSSGNFCEVNVKYSSLAISRFLYSRFTQFLMYVSVIMFVEKNQMRQFRTNDRPFPICN